MWSPWNPSRPLRRAALALALLAGMALLAGCGATAGSASLAPSSSSYGTIHSAAGSATTSGAAASASYAASTPDAKSSQSSGQYLIKGLNVSMTVPNTTSTAADLQSWIATADPQSQSAGATYNQDGDSYDISLTFSVSVSHYAQVKAYLTEYAAQHKGKLITLRESVQDVTNDYVDTQSQLANLRVEQTRLQTLMSRAASLNDILTIEQRLSDVEGQIEQIEAHLNQLNGQTSFYTIQIELLPLATYKPPVAPSWNPGQILHEALVSAQGFGEGLLTLLIWLGVYAIYLVPLGVIIWLSVRFSRRRAARASAPTAGRTTGAEPPAV